MYSLKKKNKYLKFAKKKVLTYIRVRIDVLQITNIVTA